LNSSPPECALFQTARWTQLIPAHQHYVVEALNVAARLCGGRNALSLSLLQARLKTPIVVLGLSEATLPPDLRAAFAALYLSTNVDVDPNQPRVPVLDVRKWDDLDDSPTSAKSEVGQTVKVFCLVRAFPPC
jgi:hypothetical protein